jgi:SHS2 domain-containing protein
MVNNLNAPAGYQEMEHTADWELHVWASDLVSLLETAAAGMYHLSGTQLAASPRVDREFKIDYTDRESLLVDFLAELLFFAEDEWIAFDTYELTISTNTLAVRTSGAKIRTQAKEIKAVTFHQLQIQETERGLEVRVVFDV